MVLNNGVTYTRSLCDVEVKYFLNMTIFKALSLNHSNWAR